LSKNNLFSIYMLPYGHANINFEICNQPLSTINPLSKDYRIDCFIVAHNAPCELSINNVY
jgi:hypothetical protein